MHQLIDNSISSKIHLDQHSWLYQQLAQNAKTKDHHVKTILGPMTATVSSKLVEWLKIQTNHFDNQEDQVELHDFVWQCLSQRLAIDHIGQQPLKTPKAVPTEVKGWILKLSQLKPMTLCAIASRLAHKLYKIEEIDSQLQLLLIEQAMIDSDEFDPSPSQESQQVIQFLDEQQEQDEQQQQLQNTTVIGDPSSLQVLQFFDTIMANIDEALNQGLGLALITIIETILQLPNNSNQLKSISKTQPNFQHLMFKVKMESAQILKTKVEERQQENVGRFCQQVKKLGVEFLTLSDSVLMQMGEFGCATRQLYQDESLRLFAQISVSELMSKDILPRLSIEYGLAYVKTVLATCDNWYGQLTQLYDQALQAGIQFFDNSPEVIQDKFDAWVTKLDNLQKIIQEIPFNSVMTEAVNNMRNHGVNLITSTYKKVSQWQHISQSKAVNLKQKQEARIFFGTPQKQQQPPLFDGQLCDWARQPRQHIETSQLTRITQMAMETKKHKRTKRQLMEKKLQELRKQKIGRGQSPVLTKRMRVQALQLAVDEQFQQAKDRAQSLGHTIPIFNIQLFSFATSKDLSTQPPIQLSFSPVTPQMLSSFQIATQISELCAQNDLQSLRHSDRWHIMLPEQLWHNGSQSFFESQPVTLNPIYCQTSIMATQTLLMQQYFHHFPMTKKGWFFSKQILPGVWIIMKMVSRSLETKGLYKWFYLSSQQTPPYGITIRQKVIVRGRKLYASRAYMMSGSATSIWLNGVNFAKAGHLITHLAPMKCQKQLYMLLVMADRAQKPVVNLLDLIKFSIFTTPSTRQKLLGGGLPTLHSDQFLANLNAKVYNLGKRTNPVTSANQLIILHCMNQIEAGNFAATDLTKGVAQGFQQRRYKQYAALQNQFGNLGKKTQIDLQHNYRISQDGMARGIFMMKKLIEFKRDAYGHRSMNGSDPKRRTRVKSAIQNLPFAQMLGTTNARVMYTKQRVADQSDDHISECKKVFMSVLGNQQTLTKWSYFLDNPSRRQMEQSFASDDDVRGKKPLYTQYQQYKRESSRKIHNLVEKTATHASQSIQRVRKILNRKYELIVKLQNHYNGLQLLSQDEIDTIVKQLAKGKQQSTITMIRIKCKQGTSNEQTTKVSDHIAAMRETLTQSRESIISYLTSLCNPDKWSKKTYRKLLNVRNPIPYLMEMCDDLQISDIFNSSPWQGFQSQILNTNQRMMENKIFMRVLPKWVQQRPITYLFLTSKNPMGLMQIMAEQQFSFVIFQKGQTKDVREISILLLLQAMLVQIKSRITAIFGQERRYQGLSKPLEKKKQHKERVDCTNPALTVEENADISGYNRQFILWIQNQLQQEDVRIFIGECTLQKLLNRINISFANKHLFLDESTRRDYERALDYDVSGQVQMGKYKRNRQTHHQDHAYQKKLLSVRGSLARKKLLTPKFYEVLKAAYLRNDNKLPQRVPVPDGFQQGLNGQQGSNQLTDLRQYFGSILEDEKFVELYRFWNTSDDQDGFFKLTKQLSLERKKKAAKIILQAEMDLFDLCGVPYNRHKSRQHLEVMTALPDKWYKIELNDLTRIRNTDQAEMLIPYLCLSNPDSYGSRFCSQMNSSYVQKTGLNFHPSDRKKTLDELGQVQRQKLNLLINMAKDRVSVGEVEKVTYNRLTALVDFPSSMELPRFSLMAKMLTSPGGWQVSGADQHAILTAAKMTFESQLTPEYASMVSAVQSMSSYFDYGFAVFGKLHDKIPKILPIYLGICPMPKHTIGMSPAIHILIKVVKLNDQNMKNVFNACCRGSLSMAPRSLAQARIASSLRTDVQVANQILPMLDEISRFQMQNHIKSIRSVHSNTMTQLQRLTAYQSPSIQVSGTLKVSPFCDNFPLLASQMHLSSALVDWIQKPVTDWNYTIFCQPSLTTTLDNQDKMQHQLALELLLKTPSPNNKVAYNLRMLINQYTNVTDKQCKLTSTYPVSGQTCIRRRSPAFYCQLVGNTIGSLLLQCLDPQKNNCFVRWMIASKKYGRDIALVNQPSVNCAFLLQDQLMRGGLRFNTKTKYLDYVDIDQCVEKYVDKLSRIPHLVLQGQKIPARMMFDWLNTRVLGFQDGRLIFEGGMNSQNVFQTHNALYAFPVKSNLLSSVEDKVKFQTWLPIKDVYLIRGHRFLSQNRLSLTSIVRKWSHRVQTIPDKVLNLLSSQQLQVLQPSINIYNNQWGNATNKNPLSLLERKRTLVITASNESTRLTPGSHTSSLVDRMAESQTIESLMENYRPQFDAIFPNWNTGISNVELSKYTKINNHFHIIKLWNQSTKKLEQDLWNVQISLIQKLKRFNPIKLIQPLRSVISASTQQKTIKAQTQLLQVVRVAIKNQHAIAKKCVKTRIVEHTEYLVNRKNKYRALQNWRTSNLLGPTSFELLNSPFQRQQLFDIRILMQFQHTNRRHKTMLTLEPLTKLNHFVLPIKKQQRTGYYKREWLRFRTAQSGSIHNEDIYKESGIAIPTNVILQQQLEQLQKQLLS